jgi:hypothetical protein
MKELLTHSRQATFKECRRKAWYSYELGLRRIDDSRALRMGSAFHDGIEALGKGEGTDGACSAVRFAYAHCPEQFDLYEWDIECETILRLVCAYEWRWLNTPLENVVTEQTFELPLLNPGTNAPSKFFDLAGKIDGIVRLEDGRLAVKETKTTSDDLSPDSDLWRRLRIDHQISLYIHAARQMGFQVDTVLYDVIRKPSIKPTAIPQTDDDGVKIVLDANGQRVRTKDGKKWRESGDTALGYVLQTRPMTVEEWGDKLTEDITSRPDFYFARVEVPRLDQDVEEYRQELWEIQQALREAQRTGRWYRTVGRHCTFCPHFDHCSANQKIDPSFPPIGFEIVSDVHPELNRAKAVVQAF